MLCILHQKELSDADDVEAIALGPLNVQHKISST